MVQIEELAHQPDAAALFAALRDLPDPVWLDSGRPGSSAGRYDVISAAPTQLLSANPGAVRATLGAVGALLDALTHDARAPREAEPLPFTGGLIGWLSYPAGLELMGLAPRPAEILPWPLLRIGCYPWAVIVDHQALRTRLVFHPGARRDCGANPRVAETRPPRPRRRTTSGSPAIFARPRRRTDSAPTSPASSPTCVPGTATRSIMPSTFTRAAAAIPGTPIAVCAPCCPPLQRVFCWPGQAVLSLSPEQFLRVAGTGYKPDPSRALRRAAPLRQRMPYWRRRCGTAPRIAPRT